jgi:hypothetical protein
VVKFSASFCLRLACVNKSGAPACSSAANDELAHILAVGE